MNYGLAGWMVTMPILFLIALLVWALIKPDEWEVERKPEPKRFPETGAVYDKYKQADIETGAGVDQLLEELGGPIHPYQRTRFPRYRDDSA